MKAKTYISTIAVVIALVTAYFSVQAMANRGDGALGTVYVSSQGLYYDTFVTARELPFRGPFQKLDNGVTEYGPGQKGYVGGRWWVDDGNGIMEPPDVSGDRYFLCPLLGPGRTTP
jgi:hypothetical protein